MDRSSQRAAAAFHGCRSAVGRLRASGLLAVPGSEVVTDDDGYCSRNGSGRRVVAFRRGGVLGVVAERLSRVESGGPAVAEPLCCGGGCPLEVDGLGVDRRADRRGGDEPAAEVFCGRDRVRTGRSARRNGLRRPACSRARPRSLGGYPRRRSWAGGQRPPPTDPLARAADTVIRTGAADRRRSERA
jgi:hypothetical protein